MNNSYESTLSKLVRAQAHNSIQRGYAKSIEHFNQQKNNFFKILEIQDKEFQSVFLEQINTALALQVEENGDETLENILSEVGPIIENVISGSPEDYSKLIAYVDKKRESGKTDKIINYYRRVEDEIKNFLLKDSSTGEKLAKIANTSTETSLYYQILGYARRTIFERITGNNIINKSKYLISMGGFIRESLVAEALLSAVQNSPFLKDKVSIIETSNLKGEAIQHVSYDIILGRGQSSNSKYFQNIANSLQNNISQGQANRILEEDPNMLGGIQSKSWIEPWIKEPSNLYIGYSFGNHAELLPIGQEIHMWHAGVRNLMDNLIEVIGSENFLYSTGNAIYYTADLLSNFRKLNYVLAFGIEKSEDNYKLIPHTSMRYHKD